MAHSNFKVGQIVRCNEGSSYTAIIERFSDHGAFFSWLKYDNEDHWSTAAHPQPIKDIVPHFDPYSVLADFSSAVREGKFKV